MRKGTLILRSRLKLLKPFIDGCSLSTIRVWQDRIGKLMSASHKDDVSFEDFTIGSMPASMIKPRDEVNSGVLLYLHGGGYTCGDLDYAKGFAAILSARCGIRVLCVAYRLAPEHPFPAALDDAEDAYGYLLSAGFAPGQIILCGESAGGGLCYSLCLALKSKGRTMPAGIITVSPWTDLTGTADSYAVNEKRDPTLTAARLKYYADCYAYGVDETKGSGKNVYPKVCDDPEADLAAKSNPLLSPLFADLGGMPPSLTFVGDAEILLDDSTRLHERLLAAGAQSELVVTPEMWHGYVLYCIKDYDRDFTRIRKFIKTRMHSQKKLRWMALDNAAKIFPAARTRSWSNVFRLAATMTESVDMDALRKALDVTVRRFPSIAVRVKAGFFWYYLEQIPHAPEIMEEKPYPLARMPFDDIRKCAFRVIVYDKRISVEFFHALTDGNGGLVFLKTLVAEYIYQKYGVKVPPESGVLDRLEEPDPAELEDSFFKYSGKYPLSRKDTDAYSIRGLREVDGFRTNTTFILDAETVRARAKEQGVTVTAYLTAALMTATDRLQKQQIHNPAKHKPVKIFVPVNLRSIFPSKTLRNFILYTIPGVETKYGDVDFPALCQSVQHQMKLQITPQRMAAIIAANVSSEKSLFIRACPLPLKNLVMKGVYQAVGERKSCFTFSNLGVSNMPAEFERYVDRLDFVLGTQRSQRYNTSLITYKGKMMFNIMRNTAKPLLEPHLYAVLRELGIHVIAQSNAREEVL
ncbi:MAG: alpha/beta hydrolase fold domain-containing protein [Clostridia bacterium]|nr:alpha/beta hydrolase fold domain-containing protein [Clostridia bacterium]